MHNPPYGYLPKLAQEVCAAFPDEPSIVLLTNEMEFRVRAAGFTAQRDSINKALVLRMTKTGRKWDASSWASKARPFSESNQGPAPLPEPDVTTSVSEEEPGEEQSWRVDDEHYTWESKKLGKVFRRRVVDVDQMFFAYSIHGLNMSQVQMMHDFGLSTWEWNTLKNRLMLQKLSNVFSPYTVSLTPSDQLENMMQAKMAQRYEKQGPLIERAHTKAAVKELNKVLSKQQQKEADLQRLVLELSDLLPTTKYRYVARAPQHIAGPNHLVVSIADPHIGAEVKKLLNAPRYDQTILYHYADQFIERVNARGAANVYLNGLGDFVESFGGANHANTFLSLNKDLAGARGVFAALEFFSYLISKINNVREIWGVSGNHDRTSNRKDEDTRGEAAFMLFGLLSERYRNTAIQVFYRPDILVRAVDNICYLNTHMHLSLASNDSKLATTIAKHRIPGLYCVVMGAHLHSRITKMDTDDYCVRHSPSFFTGNGFSSDGGFTTLAGFLTSETIADSGYPRVVDEPLYSASFSLNQTAQESLV